MAKKKTRARTRALTAAAGDEDTGSSFTGFALIKIGTEDFKLEGKIGEAIKAEYEAPSWDEAPSIGTIDDMAKDVATALGLGKEFADGLKAFRDGLKGSFFDKVQDVLTTSPIKVSRIKIDTQAKSYAFGFGFDLTAKDVGIGQIKLQAFGLVYEYTGS